jgi:multiple sugar transport system permease protein
MTARAVENVARSERETGTSFWSRAWQNHAPGYFFLLPWFIGFFGLTIGPILTSLYLSFTDFDLLTPANWVGTDNYVRMFTNDRNFAASMRVTLFFVAFSVPLKLAFALCVAMLLNRGMRGLPVYRSLFYLPSLLGASVAIAILWRTIFAKDGLVNDFLSIFGIAGPSWISNPNTSLWTLIILSVWQFGSPMIIFLAGLRQIPVDMYEAASLDGASKWRQFWKITLPLLTPVSRRSRASPRPSSFRAAAEGRSIQPCSIRSISTTRRSPSSAWATRRRWRGSCFCSSRASLPSRS